MALARPASAVRRSVEAPEVVRASNRFACLATLVWKQIHHHPWGYIGWELKKVDGVAGVTGNAATVIKYECEEASAHR